jgi:hypothetical protein
MTDISGAMPGGSSGAAANGTPSESDLPSMQGLDDSTDDPSDPAAGTRPTNAPGNADLDALATSDDDQSASDPMPDISGTSGG